MQEILDRLEIGQEEMVVTRIRNMEHFGTLKRVNGSDLSANLFGVFCATQYTALDYESYTVLEEVTNLIDAYDRESIELLRQNKVGEEAFVRPRSLILCKALFAVVLPEIFNELSFCRKGDGAEYTSYSLMVTVAGTAEKYLIRGRTDISVVYMGLCIMVWEDKNLNL